MKHDYRYDGTELLLRPLEEKDIEPLRLLRNRPENRKWFFGSGEITQEAQKAWFDRYLTKENDYMFAVFLPQAPDAFVGAIALYDYEPETNSYEVGRLLLDSKNMPRRGMGIQLVAAVCKLAEQLGERERERERQFRAQVFSDNERSLRCFTENGFEIESVAVQNGKEVVSLRKNTSTSR